jgi:hypothetical protein
MKEDEMPIENRQKLLLIVAIAAVALLGADSLLVTPLTKAWKSRQAHLTELRRQIAAGEVLKKREQTIRARWDQMSHRTLINNVSGADEQVYKAIDSWAQNTGVIINAITPQWKHDSDDYSTYECRIDATGDLSRLAQFLHKAERESLALKLEDIELAARDKEGQQLSLGLQFSGLVLNTQTP